MTDRDFTERDIERALHTAADRIAVPSMTDAVEPAVQRIRAAHAVQVSSDQTEARTADDGGWSDPALESGGPSITRLEPPRSRRRELALLAGGLAVAAIVTIALVALFQGLLGAGGDEADDDVMAGGPYPPAPFEIPGYDFVQSYGAPTIPNQPVDVLFDDKGRMLVVDDGIRRIVALNDDGSVNASWGDEGFSEQLRANPIRAAIGSDGRIYVYERGNFIEQVTVLDSDGKIIDELDLGPVSGLGAGGITSSVSRGDIAIDESGILYVARPLGSQVARFDAKGSELSPIEFEDGNPAGVAVTNGSVHVVTGDGSLWHIERDAAVEVNGPELSRVIDLDSGGDGSLIALRLLRDDNDRVAIFSPGDNEVESWPIDLQVSISALGSVSLPGINLGPDGTVYVAASQQILVYDTTGDTQETIQDSQPGALPSLDRIALDSAGRVFALSISGRALEAFGADGKHHTSFELLEQSDQFLTEASRISPVDVAAGDDHVIVIDQRASHVYRFDQSGEPLDNWSGLNRDDGFSSPRIVDAASDGSIYLVDDSNQIKHYSPSGEFINAFGDFEDDIGDIAVVGDEVRAVAGGSIHRFGPDDETGEPIATITREDDAGGEQPVTGIALAVAPDGTIALVSKPSRPLGGFPATLTILDAFGDVLSMTELPVPANVEVDVAFGPDGDLYISDGLNEMVYRYAPAEREVDELPTPRDSEPPQPDPTLDELLSDPPEIDGYDLIGNVGGPVLPLLPTDTQFSPEGERIFVADYQSDRVIAFLANGEIDTSWGRAGLSEPIRLPVRLALDHEERLHALSMTGVVHRIADDGSLTEVARTSGEVTGLAVDQYGIVVTARADCAITTIDPDDNRSQTTVDTGAPLDVTIGPDGRRFVIMGGCNGDPRLGAEQLTVAVLDENGELIDTWPLAGEPAEGQPDIKFGIDSDDSGNLVIGRTVQNGQNVHSVVDVYSPSGELLDSTRIEPVRGILSFNSYPTSFDTFGDETGMRAALPGPDAQRSVVVSNSGETISTLQVSDASRIAALQQVRFGPDGDIYALDAETHRVLRFEDDGRLVTVYDSATAREFGWVPGDFGDSFAIADDGTLYLAVRRAQQIVVFEPDGEQIAVWPVDPEVDFEDETSLFNPYAIDVAADGSLLVVDEQSAGYLKRFTPDGEYLGRWPAIAPGTLSVQLALSPDRDEVLVSTDQGIERYTIEGEQLESIPYERPARTIAVPDTGEIALLVAESANDWHIDMIDEDGELLRRVAIPREMSSASIALGPGGILAISDPKLTTIWLYEPES